MTTDAAMMIRGSTFEANCEALARRQPELVARLRDVSLPETARIVAGRDGLPVVQLASSDEAVRWLGGSSMPSVSAPLAVAGFQDCGTNVALAGVGTGYEPIYLARRLASHCAVFVCETQLPMIALTLSAVDMRELLDAGRIVLLDGDVEESLCAFLTSNPGYCSPAQLFALSDDDEAQDTTRLSALLARGAERAEASCESCSDKLFKLTASVDAEHPTMAVLSIDAVGGSVAYAAQIASACESLGWDCALCVPDAPERCHLPARTSAVLESKANSILCINSTPQAIGLPGSIALPTACWFLESPFLPVQAFEGIDSCSVIFAASTRVRELLIEKGALPKSVHVLETGIDGTVFLLGSDPPSASARRRIAVCCDAVDTSAKAAGISLESHERLWRSAETLIAEAARQGATLKIDALLRRAERTAKAPLSDDRTRSQLGALIATRLMKTVVARTFIDKLATFDEVDVWGDGWCTHASMQPHYRGTLADAKARRDIFDTARLVVLPYADDKAVQMATESLASKCCPLLHWPEPQLLARYPQTGDILRRLPTFRSADDLARNVKASIRGCDEFGDLTNQLSECLQAEHTVRHRLLEVHRRLQSLSARSTQQ